MVTVSEIKDKSAVEEIKLEITEVQDAREVKGGMMKVQNAIAKDETGEITISLWNADCDKFKVGDNVIITKGWASVYNNKMQISSGKFGTIEKC